MVDCALQCCRFMRGFFQCNLQTRWSYETQTRPGIRMRHVLTVQIKHGNLCWFNYKHWIIFCQNIHINMCTCQKPTLENVVAAIIFIIVNWLPNQLTFDNFNLNIVHTLESCRYYAECAHSKTCYFSFCVRVYSKTCKHYMSLTLMGIITFLHLVDISLILNFLFISIHKCRQ